MTVVHIFTLVLIFAAGGLCQYQPNWDSIDSRPLPKWYDESKIGIFLHWGVFSVPSFGSEWFWENWIGTKGPSYVKFMQDQYAPSFTYQDFAKDFDAYMYDPDWWADLFHDAGARYVVLTSKHHEGYTNWPSNVSFSWNSMDVGPKKDLIGELVTSIRKRTKMHFGLYHSLFEWFNPLYLKDKANKYSTDYFVRSKTLPELFEIINTYQPELIWSDGDWEAPDTYWNSTGFLAWLYNDSPVKDTIVVNDRWGSGDTCKHGGYWTCQDRYNPGHLVPHKWENAYTLDKLSWGYRREGVLADYLSDLDVVTAMTQTVSCGGNFLLNIGPRKDGRIDPLMEERLRNMGKWLRVNGEAIYGSQPWLYQNETQVPVWYTANSTAAAAYAIVLKWPQNNLLPLKRVKESKTLNIAMLGRSGSLKWTAGGSAPGIVVDLSAVRFNELPSMTAWVLKITGLAKTQQRVNPLVQANYRFV